jgi:hypothetical protein
MIADRQIEVSKWVATSFMTISAILVSFSVELALTWWAFVGFFVGHIIWSVFAFKVKDWALFALNFFFLFIDIYAITIRI